ncbi:hypothetical protein KIN20_008402 [Parelaphostrongylus tenuis]|uniref:Receptor expression-enhancing protein n=1 Tax=Parelaphostrongylus tenuis TaxID=148309 RepID=A0AAD5MWR6_PARTN|nr:hypothetical protein KIN20_008402 [Parelaphostrongylus tenuis]
MSSAASEAPSINPAEGIKKAHADLVASLYKSYGALIDEQLKKLDQAGVKREHVAYGLIGLVSLYLIWGQQAFFVSVLITFTYPATASVQTVFLVFYFLPQTQGATLIYQKVVDPLARAIEGFAKKK